MSTPPIAGNGQPMADPKTSTGRPLAAPGWRDVPQLTCSGCGVALNARKLRYKARYCDARCRVAFATKDYVSAPVCTGTIGAVGEMIVVADLLWRGHEVFRAQSPASSFDLVAAVGGRLLRVEVTTGKFQASGRLSHRSKQRGRFDVLAVVVHDRVDDKTTHQIIYTPPLPETRA